MADYYDDSGFISDARLRALTVRRMQALDRTISDADAFLRIDGHPGHVNAARAQAKRTRDPERAVEDLARFLAGCEP